MAEEKKVAAAAPKTRTTAADTGEVAPTEKPAAVKAPKVEAGKASKAEAGVKAPKAEVAGKLPQAASETKKTPKVASPADASTSEVADTATATTTESPSKRAAPAAKKATADIAQREPVLKVHHLRPAPGAKTDKT